MSKDAQLWNSMIEQSRALQILSDGFDSIRTRKGKLTIQDVEPEVINWACKYLLENHSDQIESVHDIHLIGTVIGKNQSFDSVASVFTAAACSLLPNDYGINQQVLANQAIIQNISWAGMWDFLRGYFNKTHGLQIDDVQEDVVIFYSKRHERFQSGVKVSESEVERNVNVHWSNDKTEITVSVEPTLSAKKGFLETARGNVLRYIGADPDYEFELVLDSYEGIEQFKLILPNRDLELIYY